MYLMKGFEFYVIYFVTDKLMNTNVQFFENLFLHVSLALFYWSSVKLTQQLMNMLKYF